MLPCGRRSGKTELGKRKLVQRALKGTAFPNSRFFAGAPTNDQAVKIYWKDLKDLVPKWILAGDPSESSHMIPVFNRSGGISEIYVLGMDKPERVEGQPWDGCLLDEFGNMKERAWSAHVRPALSDRLGWCDFLGVPEGMNHYYDLYERALQDPTWGVYEWASSTILPAEEIEAARREMHPLLFDQEYGGKFVNFLGVAVFDIEKFLEGNPLQPVNFPQTCDTVFAILDTAMKGGTEHDATAVVFFAFTRIPQPRLYVLDWEAVQMEGALLEAWLPSVFQRLGDFSKLCGARIGSIGALIEDKVSGTVLLQQAQRRGWQAAALPSKLTALGKDERALSVSGYHFSGKCKITHRAYEKTTMFKGDLKNHFLKQVGNFRIGDPDAAKRSDDLLDAYAYGLATAFGGNEGL